MIEITPDVLRTMSLPQPGEGDKRSRGDVLIIPWYVRDERWRLLYRTEVEGGRGHAS